MSNETRQSDLFFICLAIALVAFFYVADPKVFLEKLGYATLAVLALMELVNLIHAGIRRKGEQAHG